MLGPDDVTIGRQTVQQFGLAADAVSVTWTEFGAACEIEFVAEFPDDEYRQDDATRAARPRCSGHMAVLGPDVGDRASMSEDLRLEW